MTIEPLAGSLREGAIAHIAGEWGEPIVTRGNIIDIRRLPGFMAVESGELAGGILYEIRNSECEIVVLFSHVENKGTGTALIDAVISWAKIEGCRRVWLITMNDNTHAIRFYQRRGFDLKAVHINAFDVTRKLKKMPLKDDILGIDGIPIRHEFEFEILLNQVT